MGDVFCFCFVTTQNVNLYIPIYLSSKIFINWLFLNLRTYELIRNTALLTN